MISLIIVLAILVGVFMLIALTDYYRTSVGLLTIGLAGLALSRLPGTGTIDLLSPAIATLVLFVICLLILASQKD